MKSVPRQLAQDLQDELFRRMSADKKVAVGSSLWKPGKELGGDKVDYARNRSKILGNKFLKLKFPLD